jgi:hypothetical protein
VNREHYQIAVDHDHVFVFDDDEKKMMMMKVSYDRKQLCLTTAPTCEVR